MNKLLCFAHRGASGHEFENTIPAIKKAIALGTDWIEIDVFQVEGELIVFHDETLERVTNGEGRVVEKSLNYLRSLKVDGKERIPLLKEVTEVIAHKCGLNIELKGPDTGESVVSAILNLVKNDGWRLDQLLVSSFNHKELAKVKRMLPDLQIGAILSYISEDWTNLVKKLEAYSVHPYIKYVTEDLVQSAHEMGVKVFVFTVNKAEGIASMVRMGVDGVITNYPELVKPTS